MSGPCLALRGRSASGTISGCDRLDLWETKEQLSNTAHLKRERGNRSRERRILQLKSRALARYFREALGARQHSPTLRYGTLAVPPVVQKGAFQKRHPSALDNIHMKINHTPIHTTQNELLR